MIRRATGGRTLCAVLLLAALAGSSCDRSAQAAEPTRATMRFSEFAFAPSELALPAGRAVVVTFVNEGKVDHDFVISERAEQVVRLHAGRSATVTLRPFAAGVYHVICSIPTHADLGMIGTIVVR